MLRTSSSLARTRLRSLTSPRPPWICTTCQIHQSAFFSAPRLEDVSFPAIGKRKKGTLPLGDTMTDEDREKLVEKKRRQHKKFVEKLQEFIDIRKRVAAKLKRDAERKKMNKTQTRGPKTPESIANVEYRHLKRAEEIRDAAKMFTMTPSSWPSVNKKAITSETLMLMHRAMKDTMASIKIDAPTPKTWLEASDLRRKYDAAVFPLIAEIEPPRGPPTEDKVFSEANGATTEVEPAERSPQQTNGGAEKTRSGASNGEVSENGGRSDMQEAEKTERKPRKNSKEKKLEVDATTVSANEFQLEPIDLEQNVELRPLSHGLDRVLFNPGVTFLRDPRSRVYNFDPYLDTIMPVDEFDFDALGNYITSSKDNTLIELARESGRKYVGSTSSMTSVLSHFHYLLSRWRPINVKMLSKGFVTESENFTRLSRLPVSVILRWKDGVYAIDQDKEVDSMETILLFLGRSMEKMLTLPPEVFQKYHKSASHEIPDEVKNARERYHYTGFGDLLFRSQLDAHDDRLPGTGVFDLKTRGVISIRMNASEPAVGWGYQIKTADGQFESFEREYYDLIRSAFMKYSLQVRMGRMDGCFVAYHNTKRIFGFQYISIDEMDEALHGSAEIGDQEFKLSLKLLNEALNRATEKYPEQSLRLWFETRESTMPFLYFAAEPITDEEILASQEREADINVVLDQIRKSSRPLGPRRDDLLEEQEELEMAVNTPIQTPTEAAKEEIINEDKAKAQATLEALQESTEMLESVTIDGEKLVDPERDARLRKEETKTGWEYLSVPKRETSTYETAESAAEDTEEGTSESTAEEPTTEGSSTTSPVEDSIGEGPFVQVLVAQSTVNGVKVDRPTTLSGKDVWAVNYAFLNMDSKAATKTLSQIKKRKKEGIEFDANWKSTFMQHLKTLSKQGEQYAAQQRKEDEEGDIVVYRRKA